MCVKRLIRTVISLFGYEIRKKDAGTQAEDNVRVEEYVKRDIFNNLSTAYELLLNESAKSNETIKPDAVRPILLARLLGTPPSEAYFLIKALAQTEPVNGDVCEFGVAQGETSALIANEISGCKNKILHLFDSFEGLPKPTDKDRLKDDIFALGNIDAYAGTMQYPEDMVISRLHAISFPDTRYVLHKGFIENIIHTDGNLPKQVSFAYVDFDFYEPIRIALDFLHTVTSPGSIIIVDDYDFFSTGVKDAVDEFILRKNSREKTYALFTPDCRYGYFTILTRR
jgi:hypothetical protein